MSNKIKYAAGVALIAGAGALAYKCYQSEEDFSWQQSAKEEAQSTNQDTA